MKQPDEVSKKNAYPLASVACVELTKPKGKKSKVREVVIEAPPSISLTQDDIKARKRDLLTQIEEKIDEVSDLRKWHDPSHFNSNHRDNELMQGQLAIRESLNKKIKELRKSRNMVITERNLVYKAIDVFLGTDEVLLNNLSLEQKEKIVSFFNFIQPELNLTIKTLVPNHLPLLLKYHRLSTSALDGLKLDLEAYHWKRQDIETVMQALLKEDAIVLSFKKLTLEYKKDLVRFFNYMRPGLKLETYTLNPIDTVLFIKQFQQILLNLDEQDLSFLTRYAAEYREVNNQITAILGEPIEKIDKEMSEAQFSEATEHLKCLNEEIILLNQVIQSMFNSFDRPALDHAVELDVLLSDVKSIFNEVPLILDKRNHEAHRLTSSGAAREIPSEITRLGRNIQSAETTKNKLNGIKNSLIEKLSQFQETLAAVKKRRKDDAASVQWDLKFLLERSISTINTIQSSQIYASVLGDNTNEAQFTLHRLLEVIQNKSNEEFDSTIRCDAEINLSKNKAILVNSQTMDMVLVLVKQVNDRLTFKYQAQKDRLNAIDRAIAEIEALEVLSPDYLNAFKRTPGEAAKLIALSQVENRDFLADDNYCKTSQAMDELIVRKESQLRGLQERSRRMQTRDVILARDILQSINADIVGLKDELPEKIILITQKDQLERQLEFYLSCDLSSEAFISIRDKTARICSKEVAIMNRMIALVEKERDEITDLKDAKRDILQVIVTQLSTNLVCYNQLRKNKNEFIHDAIQVIKDAVSEKNLSKLCLGSNSLINFIYTALLNPLSWLVSLLGKKPFSAGLFASSTAKSVAGAAREAHEELISLVRTEVPVGPAA